MGTAQKRKVKRMGNGKTKVTKENCASLSLADLEQVIVNESLSKGKVTPLASLCNIHIHSKRRREADADGVSAKAAIDGLVHGGILQDDSPKYVSNVSYSQSKAESGEDEETIIEIWEDC